jgi:hypothetical protein
MRQIFIVTIFLFLCSTFANAQAMTDYIFLEVVGSNQKPVPDAKVESKLLGSQKSSQTDENGKLSLVFFDRGKPQRSSSQFTITKPDYYPFYDFGIFRNWGDRRLKIELLKIPKSKKDQKILGNEQLKRDFFSALQKGEIETVRGLLKSDISPNLSTGDLRGLSGFENIPAIIFPASFGDGAMIKLLLEAGADVRKKDEYIFNILYFYLRSHITYNQRPETEAEKAKMLSEYDEGLIALIKAGVDVNANNYGAPALVCAVESGRASAVKILIANGADVNLKYGSGRTALAAAKYYQKYDKGRTEYQEIIKILEAAGAKE